MHQTFDHATLHKTFARVEEAKTTEKKVQLPKQYLQSGGTDHGPGANIAFYLNQGDPVSPTVSGLSRFKNSFKLASTNDISQVADDNGKK